MRQTCTDVHGLTWLSDLVRFCCLAAPALHAGTSQGALNAFQARLKDVAQQLDSTKAANRHTDDNLGQSIDQAGLTSWVLGLTGMRGRPAGQSCILAALSCDEYT